MSRVKCNVSRVAWFHSYDTHSPHTRCPRIERHAVKRHQRLQGRSVRLWQRAVEICGINEQSFGSGPASVGDERMGFGFNGLSFEV